MTTPRITVAYSGVHTAYQMALAAHEMGELERFYCSLFVGPGKWGGALQSILGKDILVNRCCAGLPLAHVAEMPWPFFRNRVGEKLGLKGKRWLWHSANNAFDRSVAYRLERNESNEGQIFVGVETCARDSMQVAKRRGMKCILDVPQVHPDSLTKVLTTAATDLGMPPPQPFDPPELADRKAAEFELADLILIYSDVHRRSFLEAGFPSSKLAQIPLWADPGLCYPPPTKTADCHQRPLSAIFVGSVDLRKGIPYLIRAVENCGSKVELTLVGPNHGELEPILSQITANIRLVGRKDKVQLRELLWASDVLVLPSLVDTFGFVAMEAMACGLPVIVTENCGVPLPDESWRVPIMNADQIAQRLMIYADDRELCRADGTRALEFAKQFTPSTYRCAIRELFNRYLA